MKTLVSWSSGKDAAWMLYCLRQNPAIQVAGLLTTVNRTYDRVAMHAVPRQFLLAQAAAAGLPPAAIDIPSPCSNEEYERAMADAMEGARADGIEAVAFGDLFLEDIRRYREKKMAPTGIVPLFPLWGIPTAELATRMIDAGFRILVTCVDPRVVPRELAGRPYDRQFLADLPPNVDPCGENGEFHTFVFDGPIFNHPLEVTAGEIVERDGFVFADVVECEPDLIPREK